MTKKPKAKFTKVARAVTADVIALLVSLTASLYLHFAYHIPAAITLVQVLGIELLLQAWPISRLRFDHDKHRLRDTHDRQVIFELIFFGLVAAILTILNFLLLFVLAHTSPEFIDPANSLSGEAVSLAITTLAICQFLHLVFTRADAEKSLTKQHVFANRKLNEAWVLSAFILLNMVYDPLLQPVFSTKPLDMMDWLFALMAGGIYSLARTLQRRSREHTHHAVVQLHKEVHKQ